MTFNGCSLCGRKLGLFQYLDTLAPLCVACIEAVGTIHDSIWTDCPHSWHDAYDHIKPMEVRE